MKTKGAITYADNTVSSLTKRELFAAMAMQGIQSNISYTAHFTAEQKAELAVMNADALIEELNKEVQS